MALLACRRCLNQLPRLFVRSFASSSDPIDFPDMGPPIPEFKMNEEEDLEKKRARLMYQSRKRGISEMGLLLGNFTAEYLKTFDEAQLNDFDTLINQPSNDWDLYYWIMDKVETPEMFDTDVMRQLKKHARNENMEARYRMAELDGSCVIKEKGD